MYKPLFSSPLFEDDKIESFGETPAPKESADDLEDAEKQTTEEQQEAEEENKPESAEEGEDFGMAEGSELSDAELMELPEYTAVTLRFIAPMNEYGTPSGTDAVPKSGCPSCADAADSAIIDAEVAPSDGSGDDGGDVGAPDIGGGGDLGGGMDESGGEDDLGGDLEMYATYWRKRQQLLDPSSQGIYPAEYYIPSQEGLLDAISGMLRALRFITIKTIKYARKAYLFSRKKISSTYLRMQTVHKLWNYKLSKHLGEVDVERLERYEIEAWPYEVWIDVAKMALIAFDLVKGGIKLVSDPGQDGTTRAMEHIKQELESVGIKVNLTRNSFNLDNCLDKRRYDNVIALGYTKSQIPNVMRYFGEISKRVPKGDENNLEEVCQQCTEYVTKFAASINEAVKEGRLEKGSDEYQKNMDRLLAITVRFDFILVMMKLAYSLFDRLAQDAQKVFSKYEDSLAFSDLVD